MFQRALVPLDGTELAEGILPYVTRLARGLHMPLVLLTVIDPDEINVPRRYTGQSSAETLGASPQSEAEAGRGEGSRRRRGPASRVQPAFSQVLEGARVQAQRRLEQVAQRLAGQGVEARPLVAVGRPEEEIIKAAEREGCELIAMSTHGRNLLARGILGSITDKVIHSAQVPVLTITPERAKQYYDAEAKISRVVVPLDGSPLAETVLPYVEYLAGKMALEIELVRVVKLSSTYLVYMDGHPYAGIPTDFEAVAEEEATEYLTDVAQKLSARGLKVHWHVLRGAPAHAILEQAQRLSESIVALATHGRSGVTRWVLGSVAEALVRASGDPVLVVPPPR